MREVQLTQGYVALVSDEDYERVARYRWRALTGKNHTKVYACRDARPHRRGQKRELVLLHRFILDAPPDMDVDHENGDGLDCQRENIRLATRSQNNANSCLSRRNTSGFKGAYLYPKGGWVAYCRGKYIGSFPTAEDAARAYDAKAREIWGEFARCNFNDLDGLA